MMSKSKKRKLRNNYKKSKEMDVSSIRFTQKSVNNTFSKGNPIEWTINMLKTGKIKPCEIPLIRVAKYNGYYKSIDNRRLYCFKTAGIKKIPVTKMNEITKEFWCKDQSPNNGVSVEIINDPKPALFDTNRVIAYDPITQQSRSWTVGAIKKMVNCFGPKMSIAATKDVAVSEKEKKRENKIYFCTVCKTRMAIQDKPYHLNGKRHENKLKIFNGNKQNAKIKLAKPAESRKDNKTKRIEVSKKGKSKKNKRYKCTICKTKMSIKNEWTHLNGKKHRKNLEKQNGNKQQRPKLFVPSKVKPIQPKKQKSPRERKPKSTKSVCSKISICVAKDVAISAKDNLDGNKVYDLNGKSYQKNMAKHNGNNQNGKIKLAASISNISGKISNNKKESLLVLVLIGFLIAVAVKKEKI